MLTWVLWGATSIAIVLLVLGRRRERRVRALVDELLGNFAPGDSGQGQDVCDRIRQLTAILDEKIRSAGEIHTLSRVLTVSTGTLVSGFTTVVGASHQQSGRAQQDIAAFESIAERVQEVAGVADDAAMAMNRVCDNAQAGEEKVLRVQELVTHLRASATRTEQQFQEVQEHLSHIGGIVTLIETISNQTNLLALNAAIEAARAGDAGRGFAVVADEVRQLAGRTAEATTDVAGIIQAANQAIDSMKDELQETAGATGLVAEGASEASESLEAIVKEAGRVSGLVDGMSRLAGQQANAAAEVAAAGGMIRKLATDIDTNVQSCNQDLRQLLMKLVDMKELARHLDVQGGLELALLDAVEEIRAHNIMVVNSDTPGNAMPHMERIHELDGVVDQLLASAQNQRATNDTWQRDIQSLNQALSDYRSVRNAMFADVKAGDFMRVRKHGAPHVRPAYKRVKDACEALLASA